MEVQRCGPRPGGLKPSPFAYLSGSGGGAAAPGYPLGAAGNWDLRWAGNPQHQDRLWPRVLAPLPGRRRGACWEVGEAAWSPSRGGSVLELQWAGESGRPRGSSCSHLTAATSERTGLPSSGTPRPAPALPEQSGATGSKDPGSPVTSTRRLPVPARRCGASAAGPCLALGRLMRGWS